MRVPGRRARAGERAEVRPDRGGGVAGALALPDGGQVRVRAQLPVRGGGPRVRRRGRLRGRLRRGCGYRLQGPPLPQGAVPLRRDQVCIMCNLLRRSVQPTTAAMALIS